jgi:glycosyltransferase involved in cell wall biosynthesis
LEKPRITVLVPVKYYSANLLNKAVDSIINQNCPQWRLLLIAGQKEAAELTAVLASRLGDPRVEIVTHENLELACKLNAGMKRAETDFVAILLGDDMWASNAVAVLTSYMIRFPGVDFFHSSRQFIDANDQPISSVYLSKDGFTLRDFVMESPVKHLLCWRREKALSLGGLDESIKVVGPDDWDLPWSMAEAGAVFKAVKECLYLHRDHRLHYRLTTHVPKSEQIRETKALMRKHGVNRSEIRKRIAIAKRTYLRQCLYRSPLDRWLKEKLGYDARLGWREKYR